MKKSGLRKERECLFTIEGFTRHLGADSLAYPFCLVPRRWGQVEAPVWQVAPVPVPQVT